MEHQKHWYQSKTIWGSFVAIVAAISSVLGHPIGTDDQSLLTQSLTEIVAILGSLVAVFGRLSATQEIAS